MKRPPLTAAIKRLARWSTMKDDRDHLSNPYEMTDADMQADLTLLLRAVALLDESTTHTDDRDMLPVFEIMPDCSWQNAPKGLMHCVGMALVNEDAPEGAYFQ